MRSRLLRPPHPIDLATTLAPLSRGPRDPAVRVAPGCVRRAANTPDGAGTQLLESRGGAIEVQAWGPGASWLLETAPGLIGCHDDDRDFRPAPGRLRELHRRLAGTRIGASRAVLEILVPTILEQKVAGIDAARSYRLLLRTYGRPAPGPPLGLWLPPEAGALAALPYWAWHPLGVERRRAETIRVAAAYAARLEEAPDAGQLERRLLALPGIGRWTAAIVRRVAAGDPDAVELGDFHLPNTIAWALAGEARADDRRMLELLEPYRGHRGRVIRLVEAGGLSAPRRGPRLRVRPIGA